MIASVPRVGLTASRDHQSLQVRTVQPATQDLHTFAVTPVQQPGVEVRGQLFAGGESTGRHHGAPIGTVQVHPFDGSVAREERRAGAVARSRVGGTHVGPIDVTSSLVDDDPIGRLVDIADERAYSGTVQGHRLNLLFGDVQHQ